MSTVNENMRLIHVASERYPLFLSQVRKENPLVSLPRVPSVEQINALGYAVVELTTKPTGDVVTEGDPSDLGDGQYQQTWVVREFNSQELADQLEIERAEVNKKIDDYRNNQLTHGVAYDFGGDYGELHIQLRDGDRANLIGLRITADKMVSDENTDQLVFRVYENVLVPMSAPEIVTMTDAALTGYYGIMAPIWSLKDQALGAESIEDLPVVPD